MNFGRANTVGLDQILYGTFAVQNPDLVETLQQKGIYTLGDMIRNRPKILALRVRDRDIAIEAVYMSGYCFIDKYDRKDFESPDELNNYFAYERWLDKRKAKMSELADILLHRLGVANVKDANVIQGMIVELLTFAPDNPNHPQTSNDSLTIGEWLQHAHWEKMDETASEDGR